MNRKQQRYLLIAGALIAAVYLMQPAAILVPSSIKTKEACEAASGVWKKYDFISVTAPACSSGYWGSAPSTTDLHGCKLDTEAWCPTSGKCILKTAASTCNFGVQDPPDRSFCCLPDVPVCGSLKDSCTVGQFVDMADSKSFYAWDCLAPSGTIVNGIPNGQRVHCSASMTATADLTKKCTDEGGQVKTACIGCSAENTVKCDSGWYDAFTISQPAAGMVGGSRTFCCKETILCTQEVRQCPDGSPMDRGYDCIWHPEQCPTTPVDGVCGAVKDTCDVGTFVDKTDTSLAYLWECDSTGTTASCSLAKTIACPTDAKICPDGSSVGRVAPNCEFAACPAECSVNADCPLYSYTHCGKTSQRRDDCVAGVCKPITAWYPGADTCPTENYDMYIIAAIIGVTAVVVFIRKR